MDTQLDDSLESVEFSLSARSILTRIGQSGTASLASRLKGAAAMPAALLVIGTDGYGTLTASFALGSILGSFSTLGMPDAIGRLIVGCHDRDLAMRMVSAVRSVGVKTMSVTAIAALGCIALGAGPVVLWGTIIGVSTSFFKLSTVHLEYFQRTKRLLRLSLLSDYGSLVLAVGGGLAFGFMGFMAGAVAGTVIAAAVAWRTLSVPRSTRALSLPDHFWRNGAKLTALLLPVVLANWAIGSLSSLVIYDQLGDVAAGAFSTALSFASVGLIVVAAVSGVWYSTSQRLLQTDHHQAIRFALRLAGGAALAGGLASLAAFVIAPIATRAIGDGSLAAAPACVPWLLLAFTVLAVAQVPIGLVYALDRTPLITISTIAGSAVTVTAIFPFLSARGIVGAAQATLLGYLVILILMIMAAVFTMRSQSNSPRSPSGAQQTAG
jgi:O-antigen/teichoic acid export membrane protein